jgi:hypothetical protein
MDLNIEGTKSSPTIRFNGERQLLEIRGESYPENAAEFYTPVLSWIEAYLTSSASQPVTVNLEIIYANSSSTKVLMDIFAMLDEAAGQDKQITVNWFYDPENENARDAGEEFQEDLKSVIFNLVEMEATP